jgi:hypothetical protein
MIDPADGFAILQLFARYGHAIDRGLWKDLAACFTEDGIFDCSQFDGGVYTGREEIRARFSSYPSHSYAHFATDILLDANNKVVSGHQ